MEKWQEEMAAIRAAMAENMKGFAEIRVLQKENAEESAKEIKEIRELQKESAEESAKEIKEIRELQKAYAEESAKEIKEIRELQKAYAEESAKEIKEIRELQKENAKEIKEVNRAVSGIGHTNGQIAEEFFYNSLDASKTFGGIHFDDVERDWRATSKNEKNEKIEGQYDIIMLNDVSVCLLEIKSKVRAEDVTNLVKTQLSAFNFLFPKYAPPKYTTYLGIGGMAFEAGAKEKAKELGVGILKLKGEVVEIDDKNLKAYS